MTCRVEIWHLATSGNAVVMIYRPDGSLRTCFFLQSNRTRG